MASAQLTGASNGSTNVEFKPGGIELPGQWNADTVTAGATTLLVQIALPLLLFQSAKSTSSSRPSVLTLLGGTNAEHAPQVDYIQHVFLPFFRNHFLPPPTLEEDATTINARIKLEIRKRGYYPKGGGEIDIRVWPLLPGQKLRAVNLVERHRLVAIYGLAHCAGLPRLVGEGMSQGAVTRIKEWADKNGLLIADNGAAPIEGETNRVLMDINVKREPNGSTKGAGSGIVLWAEFEDGVVIGGSAVGKKGLEPRVVGGSAAEELIKGIDAGGCVDEVS
jgi:RNA 3'-terminal phosphate cyclase (ATP)